MELRFTQRHVVALNFLLIAGVVYFGARCVNDVVLRYMSTNKEAPIEAAAAPRTASGIRNRAYYDAIVTRDVFNLVPQQSAPAPVVAEDLHLKLLGTSLLSRSKPYAIIEDQSGAQSLYQVGEDIPDAGRLISVEPTRAIIDRGGQRVAIEIPSTDIPEAGPSRLGVSPGIFPHLGIPTLNRHGAIRRPARPANNDDGDDSKLELKKLGPGRFEASRAQVASTMQNPAQLFSQMRALPHFVNGKTDGFSISNVAPGSVFEQLGLQDGDMLTEIDGHPVTNPMQAMGLMQSMQTASSIDLTLQRGGSPTRVHLDLR
jgi:general secretion pathway protein C